MKTLTWVLLQILPPSRDRSLHRLVPGTSRDRRCRGGLVCVEKALSKNVGGFKVERSPA